MDIFRELLYWLSSLIFQLIKPLYDIFERLCNSRLLDEDILETISNRIGLVLGLVMFFMVTFSVIQLLLEPDKLTDKEKGIGNIVKKILVVIIMFAVSDFAFSAMFGLQKNILDSNLIQKFILPYNVDTEKFGGVLSMNLFTSFYSINTEVSDTACAGYFEILKDKIVNENDYSAGKNCVTKKVGDTYIMDFNVLFLPIVGAFTLYFLFSYCISVGIRTIQLAFLEIISPMAIVSYLSPKKETMFQKWWKIYFSTYVDVFIRVAIINLVVFLIAVIFSSDLSGKFLNSVDIGAERTPTDTIIIIIIIMALLTFAKKAPDLLKELFPASASKIGLGLNSPKKMFSDMLGGDLIKKGVTGAAGMGIGAITGGIGNAFRGLANDKDNRLRGFFGGLAGGLVAGGLAGAKAKGVGKAFGAANKEAIGQSRRLAEWRANGGTSPWGRFRTGLQQHFGLTTPADIDDRKLGALDNFSKIQDQIEANADNNKVIKLLKKRYETILQAGKSDSESADAFNLRVRAAEAAWKNAREKMITASMSGSTTFEGYELDATGKNLKLDASGNLVVDTNSGIRDEGRVVEALTQQANRIIDSNPNGVFNGYSTISNFTELDTNTIKAKNDITTTKTTKEYASQQADSKYNGGSKK